MPYKLAPLHFVMKGENNIPNIADEKKYLYEHPFSTQYHTSYHTGEKKEYTK
jgi:hypothetical protein